MKTLWRIFARLGWRRSTKVEAFIGSYHDYVFINGEEIILNPTQKDYERVRDEGGIDLCVLSDGHSEEKEL